MKVVFLDRDGVINKYPGDREYVKSWKEFSFLPDVKESLKSLNKAGVPVFVISNQAGVAKGIYSDQELDLITRNMLEELARENVKIAGVYYCRHHPEDNCSCRKPKKGLIDMVVQEIEDRGDKVDRANSYFAGDSDKDVQAGNAAGLKTILILSGREKKGADREHWKAQPDFVVSDLAAAVRIILE